MNWLACHSKTKAPPPAISLNVTLAFDLLPAGRRAMARIHNLCRSLEQEEAIRIHVTPWQLILLKTPASFHLAVSESLASDLFIFALGKPSSFDPRAHDWAAAWIRAKAGSPAAMMAVFGPLHLSEPALFGLESAARESNIDFTIFNPLSL